MIWNCQIQYEGTNEVVEEMRYSNGSLGINPITENIKHMQASTHKYVSKHPLIPPFLYESNGKKYLMPMWEEVHPDATMDDVVWEKPKPKKTKQEVVTVGEYKIKFNEAKGYHTCNCQGFWRVKDKQLGCKHIQQYKAGI